MDAGDIGVDTDWRPAVILVVEGIRDIDIILATDGKVVGGRDWERVSMDYKIGLRTYVDG